jgi:hypothetical protein
VPAAADVVRRIVAEAERALERLAPRRARDLTQAVGS